VIIIKNYGGYNIKDLEILGKGTQGSVYKIDNKKCIKIFKKKSDCAKEKVTLEMAQNSKYFPRVYTCGEDYIVREYIEGIELDKYLKHYPLTINISKKILDIYEAIGEVGYKRQDIVLFHILITKEGSFKIIDTGRVMKERRTYPKLILMD
jgi:predicted Ser/Thr protein kinase